MNNHLDNPNVWRHPRTSREAFGPEYGTHGWIKDTDERFIWKIILVAVIGELLIYPIGRCLSWW